MQTFAKIVQGNLNLSIKKVHEAFIFKSRIIFNTSLKISSLDFKLEQCKCNKSLKLIKDTIINN